MVLATSARRRRKFYVGRPRPNLGLAPTWDRRQFGGISRSYWPRTVSCAVGTCWGITLHLFRPIFDVVTDPWAHLGSGTTRRCRQRGVRRHLADPCASLTTRRVERWAFAVSTCHVDPNAMYGALGPTFGGRTARSGSICCFGTPRCPKLGRGSAWSKIELQRSQVRCRGQRSGQCHAR